METQMTHLSPDSAETLLLLEQAGEGDRAAFERLFARHRPQLRRQVAWRLEAALASRIDPSDVVQETQLAAYQRLPQYLAERPVPFRVWLHKMALERIGKGRRAHRDVAARAIGREQPLGDDSSAPADWLADRGDSPSQQVAHDEIAAQVRAALGLLPEADREILLMRVYQGQPYEEIAYLLDIEPAAARQRYGRALLRLRAAFLDSGLGGQSS